jgi:exopolysaccharide biosynthesis polyprenyl glycosylphosphotransferase
MKDARSPEPTHPRSTLDANDVTVVYEVGGPLVANAEARRVVGKPSDRAHRALRGFQRVAVGLGVTDVVSVVGALALVELFRVAEGSVSGFLWVVVVAAVIWVGVFHAFRLYGVQHLSAWDEFRGIVSATTVGIVLIMLVTTWWNRDLSRAWLGSTWAFALLFEMITRRGWRWHVRRAKRRGRLALRTLIIGTNDEAGRLSRALDAPVRGFVPLGYISASATGGSPDGLPVLGRLNDLERVIERQEAECVFVASTAVSASDMVRIARTCRKVNVEMRFSAHLPDVLTSRLAIQPIERIMALSVRPVRLTGSQAALKRLFDLLLASLSLLLTLPVTAVIALAVRLSSPGPVLFRQRRISKDGRAFTMYKFRTMRQDGDTALHGRLVDLTQPFFKLKDDPRLTRVGRLIRPFSLDELPQLWNVVRGDMSLVGPRPLPVEQVAANEEMLAPRHEVRAGLTGWWQISGRSEVDPEEALRLDLFYIENWSLTLDLYILLKTAGIVLARRGAW